MEHKDLTMIDLVGNTPLIRLKNIEKEFGLESKIYAKVERMNPTGSIKDRIAKEMIVDLLNEGKINKDTVIIEPTSGNTGIGLAAISASLRMKCIIFMPSNCSIERVKMMQAFGAECRLIKEGGMQGCINAANALHEEIKNSFIPMQFENPYNVLAHYKNTGKEIYEELNGDIDIFISSFGTGGTLTGVTKYIKERKPELISVGVEPESSPFISKCIKGAHKIQGIGAGFKPSILDLSLIDKIETMIDEKAYEMTRLIAKKEGLLVGISSGSNVAMCVEYAKKYKNKVIVTVLPDNGERYLSVDNLF